MDCSPPDSSALGQKSYVLNQDFPFNHLSKRKRGSVFTWSVFPLPFLHPYLVNVAYFFPQGKGNNLDPSCLWPWIVCLTRNESASVGLTFNGASPRGTQGYLHNKPHERRQCSAFRISYTASAVYFKTVFKTESLITSSRSIKRYY